jgi:hypothetical protein
MVSYWKAVDLPKRKKKTGKYVNTRYYTNIKKCHSSVNRRQLDAKSSIVTEFIVVWRLQLVTM